MKFIKKYVEVHGVKKVHWIIDEHINNIVSGGYLVRGAYGWIAYDGNNEIINIGNCVKKADAVKAIYKYSNTIEQTVQKEKKERISYTQLSMTANAYGEYRKFELSLLSDTLKYEVGELYEIEMGGIYKPNSVSEYFSSLYRNANIEKRIVKVEKIIHLSSEDYDEYIEDFHSEDAEMVNMLLSKGGSASDSDILQGKAYSEIINDEVLKKEWFASCYDLINVITAENRKSLLVSTQGYSYPIYIGFGE